MTHLLLGNGINMHLGIDGMTTDRINSRFREALIDSSPFYDLIFGVVFDNNVCDSIFANTDHLGIEKLAECVCSFVFKESPQTITTNFRMRLLDTIICTALTAIMFDGNKKIGERTNKVIWFKRKEYEKIFSLNYNEFWDNENACIYLHGRFDNYDVAETNKKFLVYSEERYLGFDGYAEIVEDMKSYYNMVKTNTRDIVFSPEFSRKVDEIMRGRYPNALLYPAKDLFLHKAKELYSELDGINEISVFGMSPYGDDCLIDRLNLMKSIIVYVYDIDNNKEKNEWERLLKCQHRLVDSSFFE